MKVLTRYLLRAHIGPFLFAFVALTGVILINTLAKEMANLAGKGLPLDVVLEFFVLSLPANIALTLPMAVLVSVLYTFSSIAAENEITALRASGVDLRRAAIPLIFVAALIALTMVWFNDRVLPTANYRWRVLMTDVAQTRPLLALTEQTLNPIRTNDGMTPYYIEAQEIDPSTGRLSDVAIYDVSNGGGTRTIKADSGRMGLNPQRTDLILNLYDGIVWEVDFNEPGNFQTVAFERQTMRMQGVSDQLQRTIGSDYRTDRDMTVGMMRARIDSLRVERAQLIATLSTAPTATSGGTSLSPVGSGLRDSAGIVVTGSGDSVAPAVSSISTMLPSETDRYTNARIGNLEFLIREYQVEIQKKFSIAAATLVFVLIGIPLALRFPRGGIGMVIAVSLSIFGIYYVGLIGGETLGNEGYVPPVVAMWIANTVFGVLGLVGFLRLGHEQGSVRGSGWGDWPLFLRRRRESLAPAEQPSEVAAA